MMILARSHGSAGAIPDILVDADRIGDADAGNAQIIGAGRRQGAVVAAIDIGPGAVRLEGVMDIAEDPEAGPRAVVA